MPNRRILALILPSLLAAGCASPTVTRYFAADPERAWEAALKLSEELAGKEPETADRAGGLIVTAPIGGSPDLEHHRAGATTTSQDVWPGTVVQ